VQTGVWELTSRSFGHRISNAWSSESWIAAQ
jgi:hypothetical protein